MAPSDRTTYVFISRNRIYGDVIDSSCLGDDDRRAFTDALSMRTIEGSKCLLDHRQFLKVEQLTIGGSFIISLYDATDDFVVMEYTTTATKWQFPIDFTATIESEDNIWNSENLWNTGNLVSGTITSQKELIMRNNENKIFRYIRCAKPDESPAYFIIDHGPLCRVLNVYGLNIRTYGSNITATDDISFGLNEKSRYDTDDIFVLIMGTEGGDVIELDEIKPLIGNLRRRLTSKK